MKNNLSDYDWIITQTQLWENNRISLHDIDAKSFNLLNYYSTEKSIVQEERKRNAEEVAKMLGKQL